ncbi:serine-rich adhesin for platelets [Athalia rosae]|uniref:serine-rich adhesin for platelets n=1 Tax=Athalia rosae TaxID=37344 RepID=UPI00203325FA|nr:serine-rich adhesin for platelets [Athalia rosae]
MYQRPDTPEVQSPWLVRAEVTIRHAATDSGSAPRGPTGPTEESGGLRMVYKWSQDPRFSSNVQRSSPAETPAASYEFQRGNILFTSTPPPRSSAAFRPSAAVSRRYPAFAGTPCTDSPASQNLGVNVSDSGYNSEQFSPQSYSSLPLRRPSQQYNRRCKSTCSIVLSTAGNPIDGDVQRETPLAPISAATSRTTSKCGDPWCYHSAEKAQPGSSGLPMSGIGQFSTVPEACEDCVEGITSGRKAFTTHFCTRVPGKNSPGRTPPLNSSHRDAASQTTDIESQDSQSSISASTSRSRNYDSRRKTAPSLLRRLEERETPRETREKEAEKSSVSARGNTRPVSVEKDAADSSGKDDTSKRKSRTVHIDVYCTGSEEDVDDSSYADTSDDSSSSSSSDDDDNVKEKSSTVFESDKVKVTHTRPPENRLPRGLQDDKAFLKRSAERRCESFKQAPMRMPSLASSRGYETDDVLSSLYPSQFSSYSAIRDLDSAASSCAGISQASYDSAAATSWKDTFSDLESLMNSRASLTPCDSFEYANSSDRERIEKLEKTWRDQESKGHKSKTWRSPQVERRQLLQDRKMKEFLDKHPVRWSSPESTAESDDSAGVGWSFVSSDDNSNVVRRDSTVRRSSKEKTVPDTPVQREARVSPLPNETEDRGCLSDGSHQPFNFREKVGPFGKRDSSPLQERVESRVTSPFTTPQGEKTDHLVKAEKFGRTVGAFRKPGHHVGPSKNPSCSCEHCRRFFEGDGPRGRSRSVGDVERRPGSWFRRDKVIISQAPRTSKDGDT